jgi:hypothetical protein
MTHTEKINYYFERFPSAAVLYQSVDGELFTELSDATAWAASLTSQDIVTIARPVSLPIEVLPRNGKWVFLPDGANAILQDNLMVNGFGELGGKINFSDFQPHVQNDFAEFGVSANYRGDRGFTTDGKVLLMSDSLIPMDATKFYSLELLVGTFPANGEQTDFEVGVCFFDADGVLIENNFIAPQNSNSLLKLTRPLVAGDTYMVVNSVPTWFTNNGQRNVAFMQHNFKNGKVASDYTRNILMDAFPATGYYNEVSNQKRVTLKQPWAGETVESGVRLKNVHESGFHCVKILGSQTGIDVRPYRICFGGVGSIGNFSVNPVARYMKFFVKQISAHFFTLLVADIKINEIGAGGDITPVGLFLNPADPPIYDATEMPSGIKYYSPDGLRRFEVLNGQWVEFGYTPVPV